MKPLAMAMGSIGNQAASRGHGAGRSGEDGRQRLAFHSVGLPMARTNRLLSHSTTPKCGHSQPQ
jgi:hypothetical protein